MSHLKNSPILGNVPLSLMLNESLADLLGKSPENQNIEGKQKVVITDESTSVSQLLGRAPGLLPQSLRLYQ